ncbi:MAG: T9SS type A sorting domain-containing protein [Bacteroidetes bacterium]|nr:T9SS type A sorting domain-containing protein [Bacteroidota bacterium]
MKAFFGLILIMLAFQGVFAQEHDAFASPSQEPLKQVKLYPNPAIDYVSVRFETPVAKTVKLTLHSIIGNAMEVESEVIDDYEVRLKVRDLPSGYYLLALKDNESRASYKFLKR